MSEMQLLPVHEAASLVPAMSDEEYLALRDDISQNGQHEPIVLHEGKIIDGRHRYRACIELKREPLFTVWKGTDSIVRFVVSQNLKRRHLNASQKAAVAVLAAELEKAEIEAKKRRATGAVNGGVGKAKNRRAESAKAVEDNRIDRHKLNESISSESCHEEIFPHGTNCYTSVSQQPSIDTRAPQARDKVAQQFGANPRYVQDAKKIRDEAPELLEQVKLGKRTIPQAKLELRRREKRAALAEMSKQVPSTTSCWEIRHGDCLVELPKIKDKARLIFADPPYNIGIDYGDGKAADRLPSDEYVAWATKWLEACRKLLSDDGSIWVLIGDEYAAEYCMIMKGMGLTLYSWIKWFEAFGVNCSRRFNRCTRHLLYFVNDPDNVVFNESAVTRASDRQTIYNDKRAVAGGKLWDDCWGIEPKIPRLTGTCSERIPDFPTQLPLALLNPIIQCASNPGDLIIDPFNGSGTTGVAAIQYGRRYIGIEKSARFAELATMRLRGVHNE